MKQEQRYQLDDGSQHDIVKASDYNDDQQKVEEMFPGVPIVRGNTPRPLSFHTMISSTGQLERAQQAGSESLSAFPAQAPQAPPLPEEPDESEEDAILASTDLAPIPNPGVSQSASTANQPTSVSDSNDFIWLFEYGLEMDSAILNSPERLRGQALPCGPAVLYGYKIKVGAQHIHGSTGPTIIAIEPSSEPDTRVWGVLYSIPRRLTEPDGAEPSLLDTIHAAIIPQNFFKGVQVVVHEIQHDRDVTSLVYVATETAHQQLKLVSVDQGMGDSSFLQRMATIAQKQGLPEQYIREYEALASFKSQGGGPAASMMSTDPSSSASAAEGEHNTEPLPAFGERMIVAQNSVQHALVSQSDPSTNHWLIIFSLYLACLLLIALTFATLQGLGFGRALITNQFTPLDAPWLVLMYGLLGGCVSCIVTLGRFRVDSAPVFIIISWFTRPFIGVILAILAYLLLTCGLFSFNGNASSQPMPLFLLAGALAGFGESWIFFKRT